jgi:CRP-like cAMP-binding protein
MEIRGFESVLREHPFFESMQEEHIKHLAGCASNARFNAGDVLFRQQQEAERFYIVREGRVAVSVEAQDRGPVTIQTLEAGEVLGWSWLFPPYLWNFDAQALETTRVIAMDARCLRGKCEEDPALGYDLMKRFSAILIERLQATRILLTDMFGSGQVPA